MKTEQCGHVHSGLYQGWWTVQLRGRGKADRNGSSSDLKKGEAFDHFLVCQGCSGVNDNIFLGSTQRATGNIVHFASQVQMAKCSEANHASAVFLCDPGQVT